MFADWENFTLPRDGDVSVSKYYNHIHILEDSSITNNYIACTENIVIVKFCSGFSLLSLKDLCKNFDFRETERDP